MRTPIFVAWAVMVVAVAPLWAQPKQPDLSMIFCRRKFDPAKLRAAISFPISHTQFNMGSTIARGRRFPVRRGNRKEARG